MAGTQEKIQLLLKIAHRRNEAGVEWALGASMMLYFKDITSDFHDIDLMVVDRDAECVRTILSEMRKKCLSPAKKYGKKQVRNITSWICDGKFVKAMSIAKRIFLAFINISFFDGELKMCLSLIWYCL